ncbi:MAG: hypothetical protein OXQ29_13000 [Rhodospirillaceae bacterium]|nr:hypothetical protein [Rhodospirillaceae bacterium]
MKFTRYIKIICITAATACALLFAQQAAASTDQQNCTNMWERSSASDYCPNATIGHYLKKEPSGVTSVMCTVNVTCTVNVQWDGNERQLSGTVRAEVYLPQLLKLCIRRYRNGSFRDLVLASNWCHSGTEAGDAEENGLSSR